MKSFVFGLLLILSVFSSHAQKKDSTMSLHIIGDKVYADKASYSLSFSYYFENNTEKHLMVLDYYEPCAWEDPTVWSDSGRTRGLVLHILDESGQEVYPNQNDSARFRPDYKTDSIAFYELYHEKNRRGYLDHTRMLRPKQSLINTFSLKLNKRKCFEEATFVFDRSKKYRVYLSYTAGSDVEELANHSVMNRHDKVFHGIIRSAEVELLFK